MLIHETRVALRNLRKHKLYSFINIAGLATGLAACLVLGLFIRHEASYDRAFPNADRVVRVVQESADSDGLASAPAGTAHALETRYPEIESATVVHRARRYLFGTDAEPFYVDNVTFADENFFEVFPYPLIQGDPRTALANPGAVVLSRELAMNLFGDEDPMGRALTFENSEQYVVTGVADDPPGPAHFRFDALASLTERNRSVRYGDIQWNVFAPAYTYLLLNPGTDRAALLEKIAVFEAGSGKPEYLQSQHLALQPVTSIHLHSKLGNEIEPQSDIRYLYLFGAIGLLILLIACVNYMNLSTARSASRAREVGVRKVVGAGRGQLMRQFLGESIVFAILAVLLALPLVYVVLPVVNQLTGLDLTVASGFDAPGVLALVCVATIVGILAGSYPAFFLSAFKPINALAGRGVTVRRGGKLLRTTLVVFQFVVSVALLVGTFVIYSQLNYVQTTRLGFDKEHVVSISGSSISKQYDAFKATLAESPHVVSVTSGPPLGIGWATSSRGLLDPETEERWELDMLWVDHDYIETMGLELVAGRAFSANFPSDTVNSLILSESAVARLGLTDPVVGQRVIIPRDEYTLVGIVKDFHNRSLHEPIRPIAMTIQPRYHATVLVRLSPGPLPEKLAALENVWDRFVPDRPFEVTFLDDEIERQYAAERRLARIFGLFAGLAIVIACLGLFGLAAFTAEQRTKEIGVRKVLGASVAGIVVLLSKSFARLVVVAFVLAVPIVYLITQRWLENFAFRIAVPWVGFVAAGLIVLGIALATVSYQAVRAATADPVKSLRYE